MAEILLLHTGGTIGMAPGPDGLAPAKGLVEAAARRLAPADARLTLHVFDPLIDSSAIGPDHWNAMLEVIDTFAARCADMPGRAGVIITHGTDTMAFTGAALAQALAGLPLPVLLCGSMQPLGVEGDAEGNLKLALDAVREGPAGVRLAFNGAIMAAAGLVKHNSQDADAFRSVPQAPLSGPYRRRRFADKRLAILTLSPGLPAGALAGALAELDGAVLRVYGAGTAMADPALEAALAQAVQRGCRIRAVSQCEEGGLSPGSYAAGAMLWRAGVENGGPETPEAALAHLWIELSD